MFQPSRGDHRHESTTTVAASSRGMAPTSGGSANTKGSWLNNSNPTDFDAEAITLSVFNANVSGRDYLVDIGIDDGAGNVNILLSDWRPISQTSLTEGGGCSITLPIHVPKGSSLAARLASNVTSVGCGVQITTHAQGLNGCPGFSRAVPLFASANSRGIAIDPGGTINTKGSWTQMIASCPEDIGAMFGVIGSNGDVSRAAAARAYLDIGIGGAGSEQLVYSNAGFCWSTVQDAPHKGIKIPPFACSIPAGTRIAARAQCLINTAGDRTFDLGLYGLVP